MTKQEKQDNVIVIIQVPLVTTSYRNADIMMDFDCSTKEMAAPMMNFSMPSAWSGGSATAKRKAPDVEAAIVKVVSAVPKCKCGSDLVFVSVGSKECYKGNSTVNCDKCSKSFTQGNMVWHCPKEKNLGHKDGYDLCADCGNEQLKWDELNGMSKIERDERYPVRVTLQFYQATSNGVVNAEIMGSIANTLESSKKQADFVGSLVTETDKNRPTEWIEEKSDDKFARVKKLLEETFGEEGKKIIMANLKKKNLMIVCWSQLIPKMI